MISLETEEYCQDCVAFDPVARTYQPYPNQTGEVNITVTCKTRKRCQQIAKYIARQKKAENHAEG